MKAEMMRQMMESTEPMAIMRLKPNNSPSLPVQNGAALRPCQGST